MEWDNHPMRIISGFRPGYLKQATDILAHVLERVLDA
jgi:hypothetical protein